MLIGHCSRSSLHRVAVTRNCPGFFQERLPDVRNGCGEQLRLLFLWSTKNKVHETFGHSRCHLSNIDRLVPLNMILNDIIDFAVQTTLHRALVLWHNLTFAHHVSFLFGFPDFN